MDDPAESSGSEASAPEGEIPEFIPMAFAAWNVSRAWPAHDGSIRSSGDFRIIVHFPSLGFAPTFYREKPRFDVCCLVDVCAALHAQRCIEDAIMNISKFSIKKTYAAQVRNFLQRGFFSSLVASAPNRERLAACIDACPNVPVLIWTHGEKFCKMGAAPPVPLWWASAGLKAHLRDVDRRAQERRCCGYNGNIMSGLVRSPMWPVVLRQVLERLWPRVEDYLLAMSRGQVRMPVGLVRSLLSCMCSALQR